VPHEHGALGDVRALVLDPDSHVSLGACRGLARAGAAVEVAGDRFAGIAERSRYVRAAHLLPDACGPAAPYADALPAAARGYLEFIEQQVGVPVAIVGTGQRRDQIITVHEVLRAA
jgi:hypothetical protein